MKLPRLVLCLAVILGWGATAPPRLEVANTSFDGLVHQSDYIVRGKVVHLKVVLGDGSLARNSRELSWPYVRIAEIEVESLLRGPADLESIWVLAQGTWTCDTSSARLGEHALWFINVNEERPGEQITKLGYQSSFMANTVERLVGSASLNRIAWSGRGRMSIERVDEEFWVIGWSGFTLAPNMEITRPLPERWPFVNGGWLAPLVDVERWVTTSLRRMPRRFPLHPWSRIPSVVAIHGEEGLFLGAWMDGTLVWSQDLSMGGAPFWIGKDPVDRRLELNGSGLLNRTSQEHFTKLFEEGSAQAEEPSTWFTARWGFAPVGFQLPANPSTEEEESLSAMHARVMSWIPGPSVSRDALQALEFERFPSDGK